MNVHLMSGFIGKKGIELKYAGDKPVATYSLAMTKYVKGEKEYIYADMVTWGKDAEFLKNNEDKIKSLIVQAEFNTRTYEGNNGKVYIKEFVTVPGKVEVKEWKNEDQVNVLGKDGSLNIPTNNDFFPVEDDDSIPFK